jgi:FkbM family methyltransferase
MGFRPKIAIANLFARLAIRLPSVERLLVAGGHRPFLRRHLRLGAVALGYPRVLGKREFRVAEMDGYRFYVNIGEPLGVGPYFFGNSGTVWLTRALVGPGDICVDAGANAGHYTFQCATIDGSNGKIFAFEPNPEFSALLRRSIALNSFDSLVHVNTNALWSVGNETKAFYISIEPTNSGTSSLVDHGLFLSHNHQINVQTVRFDDFAEESKISRFRLVKIDVERAEDHLLAGAERTLLDHRIDYLIVEMYSGGRAQTLLYAAGYQGYFLAEEERELVPLAGIPDGRFGDYLFVRPGLELPRF